MNALMLRRCWWARQAVLSSGKRKPGHKGRASAEGLDATLLCCADGGRRVKLGFSAPSATYATKSSAFSAGLRPSALVPNGTTLT
jgi:hypothetical protein